MDWNQILNVVLILLGVVLSIVSYYFKIKQKITDEANGLINDAEDIAKDGKTKMAYVVEELYQLIPVAYRGLFNKKFLEKLVQEIFNKVESYAEKQK